MNISESHTQWAKDRARLESLGLILPDVVGYATDEMKQDYNIAMDALPTLATSPNSAVPTALTSYFDPKVVEVLFAPTKAAEIVDEVKMGDWVTDTAFFPIVEGTGETSSYGDFNENGRSGVNTDWPQRQSYHWQIMKEYGEREIARAGLARINWVAQVDKSAADVSNRFANFSYFFGIQGMQNYGLLNDPYLPAALTPGTKVNGNANVWVTAAGVINGSANEIYADIQAMFYELTTNTAGRVEATDKMVLALSPGSAVGLTATNSYGVDVYKLLKQNFPNIRFVTAVQYGKTSSANPQGIAAGNFAQLIAEELDGNKVAFCSFTEKMRAHAIIKQSSSFKQKITAGSWGTVIRYPVAVASMVGI